MESTIHHFVVPAEFDGLRLDQVLPSLLPEHSRSSLARLIAEGRVAIAGRPVGRKSVRVAAGDPITVQIPPPLPAAAVPQEIPIRVLHQDDDLVVLDKPPGLVVHPAAGHADGTLVNALLFHVGDLSGLGGEIRPGIVHRLDKDTSGVLVVAKHDTAHRALTLIWNTEKIRKEYLALVYGAPKPAAGTIDRPIGRDPRERRRMAVVSTGRAALTRYETIEPLRYVSLLLCSLGTGRTHQIRVHLKSIGHPIVGDPLYSGPQWKGIPDQRARKAIASFPRQALHASRLTLPHPTTGEIMTFEAELPEDFRGMLETLREPR
ncbi:MAG TPA: RluA family pseudouridine synthase [Thermoanaerobaculia bacterium]|nr:RluA family pseudouridine synthase [Thermoanaerobaculia bacterium]